jgi:quercetin dioxygenase-like cupin family protein
MKKFKYDDMKAGWYIGNFEPTAFKTQNFEVAYVKHSKGQKWDAHFHKIATEINLLIRGKIKINDIIYSSGDIFIIYPNEVAVPSFLEDSEVVIVKVPSDVNDKYVVKE